MRAEDKLKTIYETVAPMVTRSENAWKEYLKFGSQLYKHQFDNALLVYAQNSKATMLATTPIWNKVGRYINKGEKGIAVCEYDNVKLSQKFLFDISQTNGKTVPTIWQLDDSLTKGLLTRLDSSYNLNSADLSSCIDEITTNNIELSLDEYMQNFETDITGHFLSTIPQGGLQAELFEILQKSASYFIKCRCGIADEGEYLGIQTISHFDSVPIVARLGYTITEISKNILLEIERNVKFLQNERSNQNGKNRDDVHRERQRITPQSANIQRPEIRPTAGQVRQDGNETPERNQPPKIFTFEDARNFDGENAPSGRGSDELHNHRLLHRAEANRVYV